MFFGESAQTTSLGVGEELRNPNALLEAFIYAEASTLPESERQAFVESDEAKLLLEKQVISRKTLVRLSKADDIARRQKMAAFQIAKERKDPLWTKLVKNRVIERALVKQIVQKYGSQANRVARKSQQEYIKTAGKSKHLPVPKK
jgi:hypothetical protein|uniref:Uncharacterized protein n=1 Tax=Myoviridae sp. ctYA416 TaxID=2825125 RepID=A0A8S5UTV6_9CAUD|nr:MAG TPA: hypothetical protein [Myoviridae sp. ctYA416]